MTGDEPVMRRNPQQNRSKKRVDDILEAAAVLINTMGYDETSTSRIAERAGIPVGTLYQFFPNKQAVIQTLVGHYLDDMRALLAEIFPPDLAALPLPAIVNQTVDRLVAFNSTHPGFNQIVSSTWVPTDLRGIGEALNAHLTDSIQQMMQALCPNLPVLRRQVCTRVLLSLIEGIMPQTQTPNPAENALAVEEMKRLGLAYIQSLQNLSA
jgi:AcrR family transcriptional regulator